MCVYVYVRTFLFTADMKFSTNEVTVYVAQLIFFISVFLWHRAMAVSMVWEVSRHFPLFQIQI